jgi:hypothetical protein
MSLIRLLSIFRWAAHVLCLWKELLRGEFLLLGRAVWEVQSTLLAEPLAVPMPRNAALDQFANASNIEGSIEYLEAALRGTLDAEVHHKRFYSQYCLFPASVRRIVVMRMISSVTTGEGEALSP